MEYLRDGEFFRAVEDGCGVRVVLFYVFSVVGSEQGWFVGLSGAVVVMGRSVRGLRSGVLSVAQSFFGLHVLGDGHFVLDWQAFIFVLTGCL